MNSFLKIILVSFPFFIFSYNGFSMESVPAFLERIRGSEDVASCINEAFNAQSGIKPTQFETKKEVGIIVGDLIDPNQSFIIDSQQAIRNSAKHMVESGHMGWFADVSHASASEWASFFLPCKNTASEAEIEAQNLLKQTIEDKNLRFYKEVFSGDTEPILIGVDLITKYTGHCVAFRSGYGKKAPPREFFKKPKKDKQKLFEQNAQIESCFFHDGGTLEQQMLIDAQPVKGENVVLRISFKKNPAYRLNVKPKPVFLKYDGFIIDFLSLYPIP